METFSKLRPPDAICIKVKIVEELPDVTNINKYTTSITSNNQANDGYKQNLPVITLPNLIQSSKFKTINSKKLFVDPQITSYEVLYGLIVQAFELKQDFQMSYLNRENNLNVSSTSTYNTSSSSTQESIYFEYIHIFNDWDLDAAFLNSSNPYLSLNVELINLEEKKNIEFSKSIEIKNEIYFKNKVEQEKLENIGEYEEWDVITVNDIKSNNQKAKDTNWQFESLDKKQMKQTEKITNLNKSKSYNFLNLDPNGRSLIAVWSNSAADKAVSVFQKVLNGISRSGSLIINSGTKTSPVTLTNNYLSSDNLYNQVPKNQHLLNLFDLKSIEQEIRFKPPLSDNEFKNFLDSDGRIVQPQELRQRIFEGGCDPNKRKELWPLLLDIFPYQNMTQHQRNEYIKQKSIEYEQLKTSLWFNSNNLFLNKLNQFQNICDISNTNSEYDSSLYTLANKIHKDVFRTDRNHRFYAGDSNKNIQILFNILMTYSLADSGNNVYAQGMSDLLSPLLFVLRDEALTYICFCSLVKRCMCNFDVLSDSITIKINLLSSLLIRYDPYLWDYLVQVGADQLMFVYRWLLIECKREFPFNDSLRVLEVMWSTINFSSSIKSSNINQKSDYLNNYSFNRYDRSNSNASSISSRLLKQIANPNFYSNDDCLISNDDDEFSDVLESSSNSTRLSNKTNHQSHNNFNNNFNVQASNSTNFDNNNINNDQIYKCELCSTEKSTFFDFQNVNKSMEKSDPTTSSVSSPSSSNDQSQLEDNIGNDYNNQIDLYRKKNELYNFSLNYKFDIASSSRNQEDDEDNNSDSNSDSASDLSAQNYKYYFHYKFNRPKPRSRYFSLNKYDSNDDGDDEDNEKKPLSKTNYQINSFSYTTSPDKNLRKCLFSNKRYKNKYGDHFNRYNLNLKKFNKMCADHKHDLDNLNMPNKAKSLSDNHLNKKIELSKRFSFSCNNVKKTNLTEKQNNNIIKELNVNRIKNFLTHRNFLMTKPTPLTTAISNTNLNLRYSTSDAETIIQQNNLINSLTQQLSLSSNSPIQVGKTSMNDLLKNKFSTPSLIPVDELYKSRLNSRRKKHKFLYKNLKNSAIHFIHKKIIPVTPGENKIEINGSNEQKCNLNSSNGKKHSRKFNSRHDYDVKNSNHNKTYQNNSKKLVCTCSNSSGIEEHNGIKKRNIEKPVFIINSPESSINSQQFNLNKINNTTMTTTSSKSSTSAYVSATSVGASLVSSVSSSCSTPFLKQSGLSKPVNICNHQSKIESNKNKLSNDKINFNDDEEELIYSLSKLDNPFLLFMCLAIFFENRDYILKNQMDANDIACYFDKMTRRHNMKNILNRARYLYTKLYLSKANVFNYIHHMMEIQNSP